MSNEGPCTFPRGYNTQIAKIHSLYLKSASPEPLCQFQQNLTRRTLGWRGLKFIQIRIIQFSKRRESFFLLIKRYGINTALRKMCLLTGTDFQVSDVAYGPLVFFKECILNFNTFFFNFSLGSNKQLSFVALVVLSSTVYGNLLKNILEFFSSQKFSCS